MASDLDPRLGSVRDMLRADGYDLRTEPDGFRVVALNDACEDCLVSKDMMRLLIAQALENPNAAPSIVLRYPADA
jgi:hypothetical protein